MQTALLSGIAGQDGADTRLLPFTAHRVELCPGVWTIDGGDDPLLSPSTRVVLDHCGGTLAGKTVVDVGCLEGGYTVTFGKLGAAKSVGVEIRNANLERCRLLERHLRLPNVRFVKGDAKEVSVSELGSCDVVFASGLLYHLDDPYDFLCRASEIATDFVLLDTHVADRHASGHKCAKELSVRTFGGRKYAGRVASEYSPDLEQAEVDKLVWSAHGNPTSFWLTEDSLVDMLHDVGFPYISKILMKRPYRCKEGCSWDCRVILVAKKKWPAPAVKH